MLLLKKVPLFFHFCSPSQNGHTPQPLGLLLVDLLLRFVDFTFRLRRLVIAIVSLLQK